MPRGGYRPGAGRKPSAATLAKRAEKAAAQAARLAAGLTDETGQKKAEAPASWPFGTKEPAAEVDQAERSDTPVETKTVFATPIEYWQYVLANPDATKSEKQSAAFSLAPYVHPKPAPLGKKAEKEEAAAKRAGEGRFARPSPPKLVVSNG